MASDRQALTIPGDDDRPLMLPPPAHKALERLWDNMSRLADAVTRPGISPRAFLMALAVEANTLPKDIDLKSVAVAGFNAAITGAILGPGYGHAFLIPFWNKKRSIRECQLVWGYKGLIDLAYETGFLASIHTDLVLDGEKTTRWNDELGAHIRHDLPSMTVARELVWEKVRAAYCIWRATTGAGDVEIVERTELAKLKGRGNVWASHPLAMSRKTAVHRASKNWKLTGRLGMAVSLEDHAEAGKPQPPLEPMPEEADPSPTTDDFPGDKEAGDRATEGPTTTRLLTDTEAPTGLLPDCEDKQERE
jgi:phage RecT family recombinase